jgi:hypothetical protein
MTRRLRIDWPAERRLPAANQTVRILAVSDEPDRALENQLNRDALGRIDLVVGCGDLDPAYLAMVGDAFHVPLVYVRGNHDRGANWEAHNRFLPEQLPDGRAEKLAGIEFVGLSWPGRRSGHADHDEGAAWRQVLTTGIRALVKRGPQLVISHAPPFEAGDDPVDPYHRGFRAYRWLAGRLRPTLWLHGHTTVATSVSLTSQLGPTTLVNVTGSTLIELVPASLGTAHTKPEPRATAGIDATDGHAPTADEPVAERPAPKKHATPPAAIAPAATRPAAEPAEQETVSTAGPRRAV